MQNEYAYDQQMGTPAIHAAAEERAQFLQRTYTTLLLGILGISATIWATGQFAALANLSRILMSNWILYIVLFLGIQIAVQAVATRSPINVVVYGVACVVYGLLLAPLIAIAGPDIVGSAALTTALIFTGLTGYVFMSGKDFSFMGGALTIALWTLFVVGLIGVFTGFHLGIVYTGAVCLLMAGFILYDTSNVLHHYPTNMYVGAAMVLLTDIVILFKNLVFLFLQSED